MAALGLTAAYVYGKNFFGDKNKKTFTNSICANCDPKWEVNSQEYPELAKFIKKYTCSLDIENKIRENPDDFFLKYDQIDRIINAERMKAIIKQKKLDHLNVAQHFLYRDEKGFLNVVSQGVKIKQHDAKLSLIEIKQLVTLAEETGFRDWRNNTCYDEQDRITFFDTEDMSFAIGRISGVKGIDLPDHGKVIYVGNLLNFEMEPQAEEWITQRFNDLKNSSEGITADTPLFANTQYDDPEIDFEQVKQEYKEYQKTCPGNCFR